MAHDWKSYKKKRNEDLYCECVDEADLHVEYAPRWVFATAAVIVVAAFLPRRRRYGGEYDPMFGFAIAAAVGALLGLVIASFAHIHCYKCRRYARPQVPKERSTLLVIRFLSLAATVGLGIAAVSLYR